MTGVQTCALRSDILIVNEGELAMLAGSQGDVLAQLHSLAKQYALHTIAVTLGAQGCMVLDHGHVLKQKACAINVIDTTAAGDTFCGSLVAALARDLPMQQCLEEASAASALACTRLGAQSSIPNREDVLAFMHNTA